jgi:hypothetical protein
LTRRGTIRRLCPHPLLHYCQYVPLDCASGSISGAKPRVVFQLRGNEKGRGNDVGPTCQQQQPNCGTFSISIYCFITTWSRRHLQPSTLELVTSFNFNPRHQLHPSSTSILLANFIPRHRQLQPSSLFKFQTPLSVFSTSNLLRGVPEVDECGLTEISNSKEETRGTQFRQGRAARCVIPYVLYAAWLWIDWVRLHDDAILTCERERGPCLALYSPGGRLQVGSGREY